MKTNPTNPPNGKAITIQKTFSRETTVSIDVKADAEIIWALLTNASDYPRWNSTIVLMEGKIGEGEKITLKSTVDPTRTFKLKITTFEPSKKMVWKSGSAPFFSGIRTYLLFHNTDSSTTFTMTEKIGGLMFPMAAKQIPDFSPSFEQFAADLKKEAEILVQEKTGDIS